MGNIPTKEDSFISAAVSGDTQFVRQCMQTDGRERLLQATTGLFSGRKAVLHLACKHGNSEIVASVLRPLVDAVTAEIVDGVYPGRAAALLGKTANQQDSRGRTPLLTACYHGSWDCAELLLEAGANVFACDKDGNSVLHLAAIHGHTHIVRQLLEKAEAQAITSRLAAAVNLSGFSPLHYATWSGSAEVTRLLLTAGVDQLQASWGEYDRWLVVPTGSIPLHVAAMQQHSGVCLMLLQSYALELREWLPGDPLPEDPRTRPDNRGALPVQIAMWKGLAATSQLAQCLQPRVNVLAIFGPQLLDEMRRKGPPALRVIAAQAVRGNLLQQLAVLHDQQQLQYKIAQQLQQQLEQQRVKQQQQQQEEEEQQKMPDSSDGSRNWQRWWPRGTRDGSSAAAAAASGSSCNHARDFAPQPGSDAVGTTGSSSSSSSYHSRSRSRRGVHNGLSSSSVAVGSIQSSSQHNSKQHHAELLEGLHRTPSITLGAVEYIKSAPSLEHNDKEAIAAASAAILAGDSTGRSAHSSLHTQKHQQQMQHNGEIAATDASQQLAPAGQEDMVALIATVPAAATASVPLHTVGAKVATAVDGSHPANQLAAASSITLGYLDRIWCATDEQQQEQLSVQQQQRRHEQSRGGVTAAARPAGDSNSSRPVRLSSGWLGEIEADDAAEQSQQQHQPTAAVLGHQSQPAGNSRHGSSSSNRSGSPPPLPGAAVPATPAAAASYQHINEHIHRATGSTSGFVLVNKPLPPEQVSSSSAEGRGLQARRKQQGSPQLKQRQSKRQLLPLETSSITLAELSAASSSSSNSNHSSDTRRTEAPAANLRGSRSAKQRPKVRRQPSPPNLLQNAGIRGKDWDQLMTLRSWKLYQQQRQDPAQQHKQQGGQLYSSLSYPAGGENVPGHHRATGSINSSVAAGGTGSLTAGPAGSSSGSGGSITASTASAATRRALLLASLSRLPGTHRRSFEVPGTSGMSAVFGASRQHVARMLREAGTVDPRALHRTLSRNQGSMAVATSLAGALPGCVSEKLVQYVDVSGSMGGAAGAVGGGSGAVTASTSMDVLSIGSTHSEVCAICADRAPSVGLAGCGHALCFDCTRCIVGEGVGCRPPLCPFCRRTITGFGLVVPPAAVAAGRA